MVQRATLQKIGEAIATLSPAERLAAYKALVPVLTDDNPNFDETRFALASHVFYNDKGELKALTEALMR